MEAGNKKREDVLRSCSHLPCIVLIKMKGETMDYKKLVQRTDLRMEISKIPFRTDDNGQWMSDAKHYAFRLYFPYGERAGKEYKGYFSQGSGIKTAPTIEDILNAINCDTQNISGQSFEDWCANFGYDTDSRRAYQTYLDCLKELNGIEALLGVEWLKDLQNCEQL